MTVFVQQNESIQGAAIGFTAGEHRPSAGTQPYSGDISQNPVCYVLSPLVPTPINKDQNVHYRAADQLRGKKIEYQCDQEPDTSHTKKHVSGAHRGYQGQFKVNAKCSIKIPDMKLVNQIAKPQVP